MLRTTMALFLIFSVSILLTGCNWASIIPALIEGIGSIFKTMGSSASTETNTTQADQNIAGDDPIELEGSVTQTGSTASTDPTTTSTTEEPKSEEENAGEEESVEETTEEGDDDTE
jgi:Sec-independent protein translocase protein TatA